MFVISKILPYCISNSILHTLFPYLKNYLWKFLNFK